MNGDGFEDCKHLRRDLTNFRAPQTGDIDGPGREIALLADCGSCGKTELLRVSIVERMEWGDDLATDGGREWTAGVEAAKRATEAGWWA